MSDSLPQMVTLKEASKLSGLSYDCVRKLCLNDKIVFIRTGSKIFVNMDRFRDYLNGKGGCYEK